jgi:octopine/nopaline transport system permease protein
MMDAAFIWETFLRLIVALRVTLSVWALSVFFGAFIAAGVTWMRVSGSDRIEPFEGTALSFLTSWRIFVFAMAIANLAIVYFGDYAFGVWFDAAILCGLVVARVTGIGLLELIARVYIFIFRGAPLLVQLFVVYYGLSSFPVVRASIFWPFLRDAFNCATLSCALCTAAYQSEIFRGALAGVPHGQVEAARACGMSSFLLFRRVIFPIALRQALPAYSTEVISMIKATALVSLVTLWDVMSVALKIRNDTLVTYTPLLIAGAIYFVVNYLIARAFIFIEQWLSPHLRARSA